MKRIFCFLQILLLFLPIKAKSDDSTRIISFPKFLHLNIRLNSSSSDISIQNPDISNKLKYQLNVNSNLKIGFFYSWLGLAYSFTLPNDKDRITKYGKSKGYTLEAHVMKTRLMVDLSLARHHGYYLSNPEKFIENWNSSVYPQTPDLQTNILSASVGYVFRPDRFSPRAAYAYTKAMRRSGGSWICGGFASISNIRSDSSIVSKEILQWVDPKLDLKEVKFIDLGASFGYAFLITILKKNFISLSFLPGLSYQTIKQTSAIDQSVKYLDALSIRTAVHFSLGRNGDKYFWGFNSYLESGLTKNLDTELNISSGYVEFFFGYRFSTANWHFMRHVDNFLNPKFLSKFTSDSTK